LTAWTSPSEALCRQKVDGKHQRKVVEIFPTYLVHCRHRTVFAPESNAAQSVEPRRRDVRAITTGHNRGGLHRCTHT
jgi:hypothetical protein